MLHGALGTRLAIENEAGTNWLMPWRSCTGNVVSGPWLAKIETSALALQARHVGDLAAY
jgi:hypothetical protein